MKTEHPSNEQLLREAVMKLERALHFTQPGCAVFIPDASVFNHFSSRCHLAEPTWVVPATIRSAIDEGKRLIAAEIARKLTA